MGTPIITKGKTFSYKRESDQQTKRVRFISESMIYEKLRGRVFNVHAQTEHKLMI